VRVEIRYGWFLWLLKGIKYQGLIFHPFLNYGSNYTKFNLLILNNLVGITEFAGTVLAIRPTIRGSISATKIIT
jgi:hypothetical protein